MVAMPATTVVKMTGAMIIRISLMSHPPAVSSPNRFRTQESQKRTAGDRDEDLKVQACVKWPAVRGCRHQQSLIREERRILVRLPESVKRRSFSSQRLLTTRRARRLELPGPTPGVAGATTPVNCAAERPRVSLSDSANVVLRPGPSAVLLVKGGLTVERQHASENFSVEQGNAEAPLQRRNGSQRGLSKIERGLGVDDESMVRGGPPVHTMAGRDGQSLQPGVDLCRMYDAR